MFVWWGHLFDTSNKSGLWFPFFSSLQTYKKILYVYISINICHLFLFLPIFSFKSKIWCKKKIKPKIKKWNRRTNKFHLLFALILFFIIIFVSATNFSEMYLYIHDSASYWFTRPLSSFSSFIFVFVLFCLPNDSIDFSFFM